MRRGERWNGRIPRTTARVAGFAVLMAVVSACTAPPRPTDPMAVQVARSKLEAGLELYGASDYALAGLRFREAATIGARIRDAEFERRARAAECTSWLRARRLDDLAGCTAQLEPLQRRARRSDPGVNTLIALGALAGHRGAPGLRVPNAVSAVLRDAARETY